MKHYLILGENNFWYDTIIGTEDDCQKRIEELNSGINYPEDARHLSECGCYFAYEVTNSPIVYDGITGECDFNK